jgi:hypothetical protein
MDAEQARDLLLPAGRRVVHDVPFRRSPGVDPQVHRAAPLLVQHLEHERREGGGRAGRPFRGDARAGIVPFRGRDLRGGRQEVDDPVHHRLDPLVAQRGACVHGEETGGDRPFSDRSPEQREGDLLAGEILFRNRVVDVGRRLQERLAVGGDDRFLLPRGRPNDVRPWPFSENSSRSMARRSATARYAPSRKSGAVTGTPGRRASSASPRSPGRSPRPAGRAC